MEGEGEWEWGMIDGMEEWYIGRGWKRMEEYNIIIERVRERLNNCKLPTFKNYSLARIYDL